MAIDPANLARWRLILGKSAEEPLQQMGNCVGQSILGGDQTELDEALEAIYSGDEIDKNEWEEGDKRVGPHGAVKGRTFPKDVETFKLGGHMMELGHCHIDFSKDGGSWRIVRIWQCR